MSLPQVAPTAQENGSNELPYPGEFQVTTAANLLYLSTRRTETLTKLVANELHDVNIDPHRQGDGDDRAIWQQVDGAWRLAALIRPGDDDRYEVIYDHNLKEVTEASPLADPYEPIEPVEPIEPYLDPPSFELTDDQCCEQYLHGLLINAVDRFQEASKAYSRHAELAESDRQSVALNIALDLRDSAKDSLIKAIMSLDPTIKDTDVRHLLTRKYPPRGVSVEGRLYLAIPDPEHEDEPDGFEHNRNILTRLVVVPLGSIEGL
jgi:hypothetical protein